MDSLWTYYGLDISLSACMTNLSYPAVVIHGLLT